MLLVILCDSNVDIKRRIELDIGASKYELWSRVISRIIKNYGFKKDNSKSHIIVYVV